MKKLTQSISSELNKTFGDKKVVGYVFLGIGLSLFLVNISSFISLLPVAYAYLAFNLSIFSSMLLIIIAVHFLTIEKHK